MEPAPYPSVLRPRRVYPNARRPDVGGRGPAPVSWPLAIPELSALNRHPTMPVQRVIRTIPAHSEYPGPLREGTSGRANGVRLRTLSGAVKVDEATKAALVFV